MDVWHITVAALRRWYILLPLLALTLLGVLRVGAGAHPQYEVTATTTLVPGAGGAETGGLYGNLFDTNSVLSIVVDATPARQTIEEQGLNSEYQIDVGDRSSVMNVTVLTDSQRESLATGEAVIELTRQELAQRQDAAGLPSDAQMGLQVIQPPTVSDVVSEGKLRNMAIVGIVGAAFSLLAAVLLDDLVALVKRGPWRRRKHETPKRAKRETPVTGSPGNESGAADDGSDQEHESPAEPETLTPEDAATDVQSSDSLEQTGGHR